MMADKSAQRAHFNLTTVHELGRRSFEIAGEDGRALWKTQRLLQDDEIVEVVHGLAELAGSSRYSIHQYAPLAAIRQIPLILC